MFYCRHHFWPFVFSEFNFFHSTFFVFEHDNTLFSSFIQGWKLISLKRFQIIQPVYEGFETFIFIYTSEKTLLRRKDNKRTDFRKKIEDRDGY